MAVPPDHVIAKALGHPVRARVLAALDGREASPEELSREFDVDKIFSASIRARTCAV